MNRTALAIVALFVALTFTAALGAEAQRSRPNIVLMMADDMGWGDPGFNGGKVAQTPHLDAMAKAGLRFERFYAAAPVCSPTRGSCVTGRHPYRYGVLFANSGHMRPQELTLAELLKQHGYATGHFGKWHLGTLTRTVKESNRGGPGGVEHYSPPWDNGFDTCFSTEAKVPTWDPMVRPNTGKGGKWWDPIAPDADPSKHQAYGTHYWSNGKMVTDNLRGDDSRIIMDRAVPFIRASVKAHKPFFAVIWFHAPHLPVVSGPKHTKPFAKLDKHAQHYFGCISALDEQVGRLRAELRKLNVADNTMLWFCSDNGPEGSSSSPGSTRGLRGRKRSLFEGGVRVPGLLEWPAKVKGGTVTQVPACTSDYLPTVLDVLSVEYADPRPLDGVSLVPLIEGRMTQRPHPIAFESRGQVALIDNQYKLIRVGAGRKAKGADVSGGYMLFDLLADRAEKNDVASGHKDMVKTMAAKLDAWRRSCKDSLAGRDYP